MIKKILIGAGVAAIIGISIALYMFYMPHRDVQATNADAEITSQKLVQEFLENKTAANDLYLAEDGDSKILIVSGEIASIYEDQLGQKVVLLKKPDDKMGVSCTFTISTNEQLYDVQVGSNVKIKGVIRSGAEYDEDLDLSEDVIMEKCAIIL